MDKKRAVELLIQEVNKIPYLKTLPSNNDEFHLWLKNVENIINIGLEQEDKQKFREASQFLRYIRMPNEDDLKQQDYIEEIIKYEIALKSIIQKYEILGIKTESEPTLVPKDTAELPIDLFDNMHLHPKIIDASEALFKDGHYAQAIFEAFKAVENFVKQKTGLSLYGKQLMAQVFNEENPLIKVTEAGRFDKDVQEGFKFLFMGAMVGIRNPKAHQRVIQKDPFITLEYLGFASFLIKRIEGREVD